MADALIEVKMIKKITLTNPELRAWETKLSWLNPNILKIFIKIFFFAFSDCRVDMFSGPPIEEGHVRFKTIPFGAFSDNKFGKHR